MNYNDTSAPTIGRLWFCVIFLIFILPMDFVVGVAIAATLGGATGSVEIITLIGLFLSIGAHWWLISRRANDIGVSFNLMIIGSFLPIINIAVWLYLAITAGTYGNASQSGKSSGHREQEKNHPTDDVIKREEQRNLNNENVKLKIIEEMKEENKNRGK